MTDDSLKLGRVTDQNGTVALPLWWAAGLPPGKWYVKGCTESGACADAEKVVENPGRISIIPLSGANALQGERGSAHESCVFKPGRSSGNLYVPGEWAKIRGAGLPAGVTESLAIYYREIDYEVSENGKRPPTVLTFHKEVTPNRDGDFQIWILIAESARPGNYWVTFGETKCPPRSEDACEFTGTTGCFTVR
jgi:hypothetical protein